MPSRFGHEAASLFGGMTAVRTAAAALILMIAAVVPANAHRPYFTQIEKVLLPDGSIGEIRLLHGDGIFFADPTRVVVLDSSGRSLARSHPAVPMSLLCNQRHECRGFDLARHLVIEIDPATFRVGAVTPGSDEEIGKL